MRLWSGPPIGVSLGDFFLAVLLPSWQDVVVAKRHTGKGPRWPALSRYRQHRRLRRRAAMRNSNRSNRSNRSLPQTPVEAQAAQENVYIDMAHPHRPVQAVVDDIKRLQDELQEMNETAARQGSAQSKYLRWRAGDAPSTSNFQMASFASPPTAPRELHREAQQQSQQNQNSADPEWTFGSQHTAAGRRKAAQEQERRQQAQVQDEHDGDGENPYARPKNPAPPVLPPVQEETEEEVNRQE